MNEDFDFHWEVTPDSRVVISISGQGHVPVDPKVLAKRLNIAFRADDLENALDSLVDAINDTLDWESQELTDAMTEAERVLAGG